MNTNIQEMDTNIHEGKDANIQGWTPATSPERTPTQMGVSAFLLVL
jgi:hypothetical protein